MKYCTDYIDGATLTIHFLGLILKINGYIFIVGKHCTDYKDETTLTILKLCTGLNNSVGIYC